MKKRLSLLIALVMLIAFVLPTIAACSKDEVVTKIEVVDAQTEFYLGDNNVIDYDNLKLKVTFEEGDPVTKTVKEWGATHTTADLSKEGATSYTVTYGGKSCVVNITVKVRDVQPSNQVTVTLHYNDGATADYSYSVEKGSKIQLTTPGYTNHTFGGWYTVNGGTSTEDSAWGTKWTADMSVNENLHLYARWTENAKVQFDVAFNNGSQVEHKTVDAGSTVTFPTEPTKEDYHFDGWYTKDGTDGDWGEQWDEDDLVTGNLNLYAKWTAIAYSNFQFFYLDDGDHTDVSAKVEKGQSLGDKLPTPDAREGYRFDGWYTKNGTTDGQWGDKWLATTPATENSYNLYARWIVTKATVTFNYNYPAGQNPDNVVVVFDNIDEHTTLGDKLPAGTDKAPEHYTFVGWFTDRTNGTQVDANTPVTQNVTYYAHWSHKTVTVTFNYNGNGTDNFEKTVNEGATLGQDNWPADPSWANHRFVGWYDEQTEGGTQYTANTAIATNKTLYARWVETATVTFDLNGADGTPHDPVTVDKGQSLGATNWPTDPTRQGYRFDGWYTKTGDALDTTKWSATTTTTGNTTLYAKWVKQVTVTFNANGGNADSVPGPVTVDENTSLGSKYPSTQPTRNEDGNTKYVFVGWFADSQGSGEAFTNATVVGSDDVTWYAKWQGSEKVVTYTLKYDDGTTQDGKAEAEQGGKVSQWPNPSRRGYDFLGWFDVQTTGGTRYDTDSQPEATESKTLYAHWQTKQSYTVTFDWNFDGQDDTVVTDKSGSEKGLYSGEKVNIPETIDRENYRFDGWYTDESCTEGHKFSDSQVTIGDANVTLYAKWIGRVTVYFSTGIENVASEDTTYYVLTKTVDVNTQISIGDMESQLKKESYYAEFAKGNEFLGWFDDQIGGNAQDGNYSVGDVPGYKYFYAHWQVRTVTIVLDYNLMDESERLFVDWGTVVDLSEHVPTLKGYVFAGWYSDKENQTDATKKETIEAKPDNPEEAITLYAKWNHSVRVNIILGNGQPNIGAEVPTGATLITDLVYNGILGGIQTFVEQQYSGMGSTAAAFVQKVWPWTPGSVGYYYNSDYLYSSDPDNHPDVKDQSDLVEVFKQELPTILGLYKQGQEKQAAADLKKIIDDGVKMIVGGDGASIPTREGYTHGAQVSVYKSYWYHFVSGKTAPWPVWDEKGTQNYIIDSDLFLYAQWTAVAADQTWKVTLHYNNEHNDTFDTRVNKDAQYNPPTPMRNGYDFVGWYTKNGAQSTSDSDWGEQWMENQTVTADTDLYARWKPSATTTYLVTLNNGTETRSFVVKGGQTLESAANEAGNEDLKAFLATADTWLNGAVECKPNQVMVDSNLYLVAKSNASTATGLVMSFSAPDSYNSYKQRSTNTGDSLGYFKRAGSDAQPYEVGTVNKFIFRPIARIKPDSGSAVYDYNPTTTATVEFRKESETFENSSLKANNLTDGNKNDWVTVDNNTYKFSESIEDGTFVRLTVSLTGGSYKIPSSVQNKVTAEFKLVKGGYNVYDQRGLSVMNDNQQVVWSPLWGVEAAVVGDPTNSDEAAFQYKVEFRDPSTHQALPADNTTVGVTLAADDKPLYRYVGDVDWVILHNDIDLDPTQMPQDFFWQAGDPLYYAAYQSLAGWKNQQDGLVGTLKDGDNSDQATTANYMPVYDLSPTSTESSRQAFQVGIYANMQKGLYSTHKVSVSGNYFSLTHILERGGRKLQNYVDWQTSTKVGDPITHWSVFQLITNKNHNGIGAQSTNRGTEKNPFTVKNIAMKGSTPQKDYYDQGKTVYFAPAGIMLANTYASINFDNINANNFFTVIVGDNYGESATEDADGNVKDGFKTAFTVTNSKLYDVYSNMIYTWRGHIHVSDSEFVGSGGPLFILCDDNRLDEVSDDKNGPTLDVSGNCRLEAYATGAESWYDANNAAALVTTMRGAVDTGSFNKLGKTIRWVKDGSKMRPFQGDNADGGKNQYINIIAVMICSPGSLMSGVTSGGKEYMPAVEGTTTFENATINGRPNQANATFAMHSETVRAVKAFATAAQPDKAGAAAWPILAQMGNYWFASGLDAVQTNMDNGIDMYQYPGLPNGGSVGFGKETTADTNGNIVCVYLSAAVLTNTSVAPYFGVVLGIGDYPTQAQ